jgi:hypothetical protein
MQTRKLILVPCLADGQNLDELIPIKSCAMSVETKHPAKVLGIADIGYAIMNP